MLKLGPCDLELVPAWCDIRRVRTTHAERRAELYDHDFLLWTREQSKLLREAAERRVNFPLDWENLAEEIESLGRSLRSELRSRLRTIIEHLLKLEHSAAREPRNGWIETVERTRGEAELLLEENPSLRRELADLIDTMFERFAEIAVNDLIRRGELDKSRRDEILARRYTAEQVLQDVSRTDRPDPRSHGRNRRNGAALEAVARHKKAAPAG